MEFISSEEFLKQSKKIQNIFLDWWKPTQGDLYCNIYNNQQENVLVINNCQLEVFKSFKDDIKQYGCPLFTETQLQRFIEDKTWGEFSIIECIWDNETSGYIIKSTSNCQSHIIYTYEKDMLQAYWKTTLQLAKEAI